MKKIIFILLSICMMMSNVLFAYDMQTVNGGINLQSSGMGIPDKGITLQAKAAVKSLLLLVLKHKESLDFNDVSDLEKEAERLAELDDGVSFCVNEVQNELNRYGFMVNFSKNGKVFARKGILVTLGGQNLDITRNTERVGNNLMFKVLPDYNTMYREVYRDERGGFVPHPGLNEEDALFLIHYSGLGKRLFGSDNFFKLKEYQEQYEKYKEILGFKNYNEGTARKDLEKLIKKNILTKNGEQTFNYSLKKSSDEVLDIIAENLSKKETTNEQLESLATKLFPPPIYDPEIDIRAELFKDATPMEKNEMSSLDIHDAWKYRVENVLGCILSLIEYPDSQKSYKDRLIRLINVSPYVRASLHSDTFVKYVQDYKFTREYEYEGRENLKSNIIVLLESTFKRKRDREVDLEWKKIYFVRKVNEKKQDEIEIDLSGATAVLKEVYGKQQQEEEWYTEAVKLTRSLAYSHNHDRTDFSLDQVAELKDHISNKPSLEVAAKLLRKVRYTKLNIYEFLSFSHDNMDTEGKKAIKILEDLLTKESEHSGKEDVHSNGFTEEGFLNAGGSLDRVKKTLAALVRSKILTKSAEKKSWDDKKQIYYQLNAEGLPEIDVVYNISKACIPIEYYIHGCPTNNVSRALINLDLPEEPREGPGMLLFDEDITFGTKENPGIAAFLSRIAKAGVSVGVIVSTKEQKELLIKMNKGLKKAQKIIGYDSFDEATTTAKSTKRIYFYTNNDNIQANSNVTVIAATDIVAKIIAALGEIYGVDMQIVIETTKSIASAA